MFCLHAILLSPPFTGAGICWRGNTASRHGYPIGDERGC